MPRDAKALLQVNMQHALPVAKVKPWSRKPWNRRKRPAMWQPEQQEPLYYTLNNTLLRNLQTALPPWHRIRVQIQLEDEALDEFIDKYENAGVSAQCKARRH